MLAVELGLDHASLPAMDVALARQQAVTQQEAPAGPELIPTGRVISVVSPKGGVGKTTTLAVYLTPQATPQNVQALVRAIASARARNRATTSSSISHCGHR